MTEGLLCVMLLLCLALVTGCEKKVPPANQPPTANPGGPYSGSVGTAVAFDGSGSTDPDHDPLTLIWDFGDGASATGSTPHHTYTAAGTFAIKLTANDGRGGSRAASTTATIVAQNKSPTAKAGGPYSGSVGQSIVLNGIGSTDPDHDSLSFTWNFGDGQTGTGATPSYAYATAGTFNVTLTVDDGHGGTNSATTTATLSLASTWPTPPPDPASVAPPLSATTATSLKAATEFLYTGTSPIQTGVSPGTIELKRVAVLRGKVRLRDGTPLPTVKISALGHTEFGQTLSRADGAFDLAVNGGGQITVCYEKNGYLAAQRAVVAPWQDYSPLPDVVMIPLDPNVNVIDLSATTPIQVARGSVVTDSDGVRQETLLFPQGTTAIMTLPDGTKQTLTTLHVRSTEYTVGADGAKTMPAALPPNSAYTYATEFSADEAVAARASDLQFNQPIISYNENFLSFPVGGGIPMGYYDSSRGVWVSSDSGRVIKVLSFSDGKADLDIDGSGTAASAAALAILGVTDAERATLTSFYTVGQSLWRTAITHFSGWDKNQGTSPKEPAPEPPAPIPDPTDAEPDRCPDDADDAPTQSHGIIGPQNQSLGEVVSVIGTPFYLRYQSNRVPGYTAASEVRIPLSGPTISPTLARIDLEIYDAGQTIRKSYAPAANLNHTYAWNGTDAYGRTLHGTHPITTRLSYVYPLVYQQTGRFGYNGSGNLILGASTTRAEFSITKSWTGWIGNRNARAEGLGGWTLNVHHAYDPEGQILSLGDGSRRRATSRSFNLTATVAADVITTVAGNGHSTSHGTGDNGLAVQAELVTPRHVAVGPDGAIYISDDNDNRIRRVGNDGIITAFAGNGTPGFSGDKGPATLAQLDHPRGIAVSSDGSVYISDWSNHRIRRVGTDGVITTVAGNGLQNFSGDGNLATAAGLAYAADVAVGQDGSLYIADFNRIRRVGTDNIITTVAGNATPLVSGDGGPATNAHIQSTNVAVGSDGSLYIVDLGDYHIRRVGLDGIITSIAGGGTALGDGGLAREAKLQTPEAIAVSRDGLLFIADARRQIRQVTTGGIITTIAGNRIKGQAYSGDGGPAAQAQLNTPTGVAVGPDGSLYIADSYNGRIRRVASGWPKFATGDIGIAAEDGSQVYQFDSSGRHLRTRNALTGETLLEFGYDAVGHLNKVTEKTGGTDNVTTIEHDAAGNPTAIVAPFSQRTTLAVDSNGYLNKITNPANESVKLISTRDGLLTQFTDPRNNSSQMTYDTLGRLTRDADGASGFKSLSRIDADQSYTVTVATAMGITNTYEVERLSNGDQRRVSHFLDGTQTEFIIGADGSRKTTLADGTITTLLQGPDPRFSMQAPLPASVTTTTGGLTSTLTTARTATLANPNDPLSLVKLTDKITLNGRIFTNVYDAASKTTTSTSAEGRKTKVTTDSLGRIVQAQTTGLLATSFTYDAQDRLSTISEGTGADQRTATLSYSSKGYLDTVMDPLDQPLNFAYDDAGRVSSQTLPDLHKIGYGYDANGNLTSITPPARPPHLFSYTPVNLQEVYTPPDVGAGTNSTPYSYNLDKQLALITRPDGETLQFEYEGAAGCSCGRLSTLTLPTGVIRYAYDPTTGKLNGITVPDGGLLSYTYTGALLTQTAWTGSIAGTVSRTYDNDFRVTSLSVDGANAIAFQYDRDSLLTQAGSLTLSRDPLNGLLKGTTLGSVTDSLNYNGFGEVADYTASYNGSELFKTVFTYDKLGRIETKTGTVGGTTATFKYVYDLAARLTEVKKDGTITATYTYDSNGNRLTASGLGASYDAQDRLTSYGSTNFSYTANGELLSKTVGTQTTSYQYDALGNLLNVTLPGGTVIDYLIDGGNRRIGKKINGALVQAFLYQGALRPVAELDGTGALVSRFVYGTRDNVPEYVVKTGITYRIITDHLGSPRLVVNTSSGAIIQRMDYDSFGVVTADTNPGFQPFGYAGGLLDRDTKLVRFGARDYDAETGRWTAKDPILFAGGDANLYAYAFNDPVNLRDPAGFDPPANLLPNELPNQSQDYLPKQPSDFEPKKREDSPTACEESLEEKIKRYTHKRSHKEIHERAMKRMVNPLMTPDKTPLPRNWLRCEGFCIRGEF